MLYCQFVVIVPWFSLVSLCTWQLSPVFWHLGAERFAWEKKKKKNIVSSPCLDCTLYWCQTKLDILWESRAKRGMKEWERGGLGPTGDAASCSTWVWLCWANHLVDWRAALPPSSLLSPFIFPISCPTLPSAALLRLGENDVMCANLLGSVSARWALDSKR